MQGLLLLDVSFKDREGLKLLQEVSAEVPYKSVPMLCLALGFSYCQEPSKALLVMQECMQRFKEHSHLCYIFIAYFRVQEILLLDAEEKPLVPEFAEDGLELKESDEKDLRIAPLFTENHVIEVDLLFKKSISKLLLAYDLKSNEHEVSKKSQPRPSEAHRAGRK